MRILEKNAGSQFDPALVSILAEIKPAGRRPEVEADTRVESIHALAQMLASHGQTAPTKLVEMEKI
jgi:hypothetical protein